MNTGKIIVAKDDIQKLKNIIESSQEEWFRLESEIVRWKEEDKVEFILGQQLIKAAGDGNLNSVKSLIGAGADVNAVGDNMYAHTPLTISAPSGHLEVVKFLIENGANINALCGDGGWSALALAMNYDRRKVVDYLKSVGAKAIGGGR